MSKFLVAVAKAMKAKQIDASQAGRSSDGPGAFAAAEAVPGDAGADAEASADPAGSCEAAGKPGKSGKTTTEEQ